MPYTIYTFDESALTFSGGAVLSGIDQGDGSHLVGETMTLGAGSWQPVEITDDDDDFSDNDGSQRLADGQTVNGVFYANDNPRVEAEFSFVVEDAAGNQWTLVAFNVNNSSPSYATNEAIAVIGDPGTFPPPGTQLTVMSAAEGPSFAAASYVAPLCFVSGTVIETTRGPVPVEHLNAGDLLLTRDHGPQPLRWAHRQVLAAEGAMAPICFAPGVLGNDRALRLSPQHRVLIADWRAELYCGAARVMVPAQAFLDHPGVRRCTGGAVTYHHLLLDRHEILTSDGAETESFLPGPHALAALTAGQIDWFEGRMPGLARMPDAYGPLAAPEFRGAQARAIARVPF